VANTVEVVAEVTGKRVQMERIAPYTAAVLLHLLTASVRTRERTAQKIAAAAVV